MKLRKVLSLALCAVLLFSLSAPALAESEPSDAALMAVTAKVKTALGLDTDAYTDFSGWSETDTLSGTRWYLEWNGDGISLSVTCDENGKIYSYSATSDIASSSSENGSGLTIPSLPEDKTEAAFAVAQAFVAKAVNLDGESVTLENDITPSLTASTYRFRGEIQVNGLPTPIGCSVTIRIADLSVSRFRRDDAYSWYVSTPNTPLTNVSEEGARRLLRGTLALEPQYVLDEDGTTAYLRYVPTAGDDYYVDGATGQLVNLTELQATMQRKNSDLFYGMTEDAAASESNGMGGLSKAELEGAAKLAGARSQEMLDTMVKNAWPEIGLTSFTLSSFRYTMGETDKETGETPVTAHLTYAKQLDEEMYYKYVTMDAKSGTLESLFSYRGSMKNSISEVKYRYGVNITAAQSKAETALISFAGKNYASLGLKNCEDARNNQTWEHVFRFEQEQDGYFYHDNNYVVGIDANDGTLTQLSGSFNDAVQLVPPAHSIASLPTAQSAFEGALTAKYGYLEVPVSVTSGEYFSAKLKELGYEYLTALRSGWVLTATEGKNPRMVDALTGEVIYYPEESDSDGIAYADLEGHWVQSAADALARYGIGLYTETLDPSASLTQLDLVALLASVEGYRFDLSEVTAAGDSQDSLYRAAYRMGIVTPETRDPQRLLTRGELVKLLLNSAGYEAIASLNQIFTASFADWGTIPVEERGYAALAQGLGLVNGGSEHLYAGARTATRAEAVAMLYQYMSR